MLVLRLICLLVLSLPSFCNAAEATRALTVREAGATLYAQQEAESDKIAILQKGQPLTPLAAAVGQQTWYMVKTPQWFGRLGTWNRRNGRRPAKRVLQREGAKLHLERTNHVGALFEGGWTVKTASSADKASGTWTLGEGFDKTVLRGTWSAQKFSTGWSGTWRATIEGQKQEFTGSWTADFPQARETSIAELFSTIARDAIRGIWSADNDSGSWAIRTAK